MMRRQLMTYPMAGALVALVSVPAFALVGQEAMTPSPDRAGMQAHAVPADTPPPHAAVGDGAERGGVPPEAVPPVADGQPDDVADEAPDGQPPSERGQAGVQHARDMQGWASCVGEAAPQHDDSTGAFDPVAACGTKPSPPVGDEGEADDPEAPRPPAAGPPADAGPPTDAGPPADAGPPTDAGPPDAVPGPRGERS